MVRLTPSVAGSMTEMLELRRLVTQTSPFGAIASARGALPTAISPSFWLLDRLNALTVLPSWLTTQSRPALSARFEDSAGRPLVSGWCTICAKVCVCVSPRSSFAVTVTQNIDGRENVCVTLGEDDQPVSVPSSKYQRYWVLMPLRAVAV